MTLLAVATEKQRAGVDHPGSALGTTDWRADPGTPANTRGVTPVFVVGDMVAALERVYKSDAHLVAYLVTDPAGAPLPRQPRVNKGGLPWLREQGYGVRLTCLVADVDNPMHGPWTAEQAQRVTGQLATLPLLQTCAYYAGDHGWRLVQPLSQPLDAEEGEAALREWVAALQRAGVAGADERCASWNWLFRMPHVRRADNKAEPVPDFLCRPGGPRRWPLVTATAEPRGVDDLLGDGPRRFVVRRAAVSQRARVARSDAPPTYATALPDGWAAPCRELAAAMGAIRSEWHTPFLALAGGLLRRGVDPELVPAVCEAVSRGTGCDTRTADRVDGARTTVARYLGDAPLAEYDALLVKWPELAAALDAVTASGVEARLRSQCAPEPVAHPTAAEIEDELRDAIANARVGASVVVASCGLGKTRKLIEAAQLRAATPYRSATATGARAPANSVTVISENTNELAIEVCARLTQLNVPSRRMFSPASLLGPDGVTPVCRFYESARAFADGGQSVRREFCQGRGRDPCPHLAACPAASGIAGPADARVVVGNHGMLGELAAEAGATGLLAIDEPPPLLESAPITPADLAATIEAGPAFEPRYRAAMRPALVAFNRWLLTEPADAVATVEDAVRAYAAGAGEFLDEAAEAAGLAVSDAADPGDVAVDAARRALDPARARGDAPPIERRDVLRARTQPAWAARLGVASRVYAALHHALTAAAPPVARVEARDEVRAAVLTGPRADLADALRRDGATVVLDATADLPALSRAAGYDLTPYTRTFWARDGAPIKRTMLRWAAGSRKYLFAGNKVVLDRFAAAVRLAVRWALEAPEGAALGVVTLMHLETLLLHSLAPDDAPRAAVLRQLKYTAAELDEIRAALQPILAEWTDGGRRTIVTGHYGKIRGFDAMKDVDALVTLGDPWPPLADVREGATYLGLAPSWEARYEFLARAELEQAHGRIRAPHRCKSGRALAIGNVLPSGPGWDGGVEFRRMASGRPRADSAITPDDLRTWMQREDLSVLAAARRLQINRKTVYAYLRGEWSIPTEIARVVGEPRGLPI